MSKHPANPNPHNPNLHNGITNWKTASNNAGTCVEFGSVEDVAAFRDTKQSGLPDAARPMLTFSREAAAAFLRAAAEGRFPRSG